jgi:hypothetical protein
MKTISPVAPARKADASLDAKLNPVELSSTEIVSWSVAFPRSGSAGAPRTEYRLAALIKFATVRRGRDQSGLGAGEEPEPAYSSRGARIRTGDL